MSPETLQVVTLTTAIVGAVAGIGALIWNLAAFYMTGPRVAVTIGEARVGEGGAFTGPKAWDMTTEFESERAISIEVVNRGRVPTTVLAVGVMFPNGAVFHDFNSFGITQKTKFRLDGLSSEALFIEHGRLAAYAKAMGLTDTRLRAKANLATGKVVRSKYLVLR